MIIGADEIHVWEINLCPSRDGDAHLIDFLSNAERERAKRFVFEYDRIAYIRSHATMRCLIANYLGRAADEVRFGKGEFGKPYIVDGKGLVFNLSHSSGLALLAIARDRDVGIDIERMREGGSILEIADKFFSTEESADIHSRSGADQLKAFYKCWTRKEAYIKALGRGLSLPLNSFSVPIRGLESVTAVIWEGRKWYFLDVRVEAPYLASLVVEGDGKKLRYCRSIAPSV